ATVSPGREPRGAVPVALAGGGRGHVGQPLHPALCRLRLPASGEVDAARERQGGPAVLNARSTRLTVLLVVLAGAALQLTFTDLRVTVLLQAINSGLSPALIGFLQASFSAASLLALYLGRSADRFGARPAMLCSVATALAAAVLMGGWPWLGAGVL